MMALWRGLVVFTVDKSKVGETGMGGVFRYFAVIFCWKSRSAGLGDNDLAWLSNAASASVFDLRGARFSSLVVTSSGAASSGSFSESDSIAVAPSTGISTEDAKVFMGLLGKVEGKVLESACDGLPDMKRGDLPRREGVPRAVAGEELACMSTELQRVFQEDF